MSGSAAGPVERSGSPPRRGDASSSLRPRGRRSRRALAGLGGAAVCLAGMVGLVAGGVHNHGVVSAQTSSHLAGQAQDEDAFYRCVAVQTRSLVGPDQPVQLAPNLATVGQFLGAAGTWLDLADQRRSAPVLSLEPVAAGPSCRGLGVVERVVGPDGRVTVRRGHGASAPGRGPLPPEQQ